MKKRMKQFLTGLCFALLLAGSAVLLEPAPVEAAETDTYGQVCCGSGCSGGENYCKDEGEYTCCE